MITKPALTPDWRWWLVALVIGALCWTSLALTLYGAASQRQEPALGDCLPEQATYSWRGETLNAVRVLDLQSIKVQSNIRANYDLDRWETEDGAPLDIRWQYIIRLDYGDGRPNIDAVIMIGATANEQHVAGVFLHPTDGGYDWHGKCTYLIDADTVPDWLAEEK